VTWNPGARPVSRKKPILITLGVIFASILVVVTVIALWFENVIITTGPSRTDVERTAGRIIRSDIPGLPGKSIPNREKTYYSPCGHQDGVQPLSAYVGVSIRISGVPASRHDAFEKALNDRTVHDLNKLPEDQSWSAIALWDSGKSSTGEIDVGVACALVARWP
jgi:hypothetical protein